ncbi:MAG: formate dehydrogenase accessory sulfurtransferase FdhD [Gemmatimonadales bacterium]|jgi:FdhD protein
MSEPPAAPLAPEAVVELCDADGPLARWFCTPEHLRELAVGWLLGEGRIAAASDLGPVVVDDEAGQVRLPSPSVDLHRPPVAPPAGRERAPAIVRALLDDREALRRLFQEMFERGELRERSGGIHTGALVADGEVLIVREDVSRHCVVDKLVGRALLDGRPLTGTVLLLSGRISGTIAAKGARAGLAVMATMSIPTTLAAEIAGRAGLTLIGRARAAEPHLYPPAR